VAAAKALVTRFDGDVDGAFDSLRGRPWADHLFYTASELGDFSLLWFMFGAARGLRSGHHWRAAMRVAGGVTMESLVVNLVVKSLFRRHRPQLAESFERPRQIRQPLTSSFPSGHATSSFAAATLLADRDFLWPLYYSAAVVVASSRVHVKIHHASDVVAGAFLGLVMGRALRQLVPLRPPSD